MNIWAPVDSSGKKLPVIVYIYGGGYQGGSSSAPFMSGEFLAEKGVVYVNFNYRLSVPGNLGLPELTAESPHKASGNYVHLDEGSRDLTNVKTLDEYMAVVKRVAGKKAGEMLNLYTASTDEEARQLAKINNINNTNIKEETMRKTFINILLTAICITALLAPACTSETPITDKTPGSTKTPIKALLKIDSGYISGTVNSEKPVYIFRGIPYAAPPVGDLRWKPPQPVKSWSGVRECTDFGTTPSQDMAGPTEGQQTRISEDCLYLNVQTPAEDVSDKLPVMVWFHGGCYHMGSGNTPDSNSPALPKHGIVLVSVTHRLGVMGLMAASELSGESPDNASGNYMVLDLIASLKWIQSNIAAFGGDPGNVTIAGFSGGGGKVIGMLASPLAKGLFHRAIIESGSLYMMFPGTPLKENEALGDRLLTKLGVKTLAEARALDWKTIEKANSELGRELNKFTPAGPVWNYTVDGYVFPESHDKIIREGNHNAVPLLGVANYGEIFGARPSTLKQIPAYMDIFKGNIKKGTESYACIFGLVPAGWRKLGGTTGHGNELPYVFGFIDLPWAWSEMRIGSAFGQKRPEGVTTDAGVTDGDIRDADKVMTVWARFMKTGNPGAGDLTDWTAWDEVSDKYADIGYPFQVKSGYSGLGK